MRDEEVTIGFSVDKNKENEMLFSMIYFDLMFVILVVRNDRLICFLCHFCSAGVLAFSATVFIIYVNIYRPFTNSHNASC